jgi:hypothetical protein
MLNLLIPEFDFLNRKLNAKSLTENAVNKSFKEEVKGNF